MHRDFPSSWCLGDIEDMVSHKDSLNWIREHKRASPIPSHLPCRPGPRRNVWMEDLLGQFCWASSPCRPSRPGPSSRWWREMPRCGAAGCASVPLRTVTAREAANTNLSVCCPGGGRSLLTPLSISSVTRWTPLCWGLRWTLRCSQALGPTMRPEPWWEPWPEPLLWFAEQAMELVGEVVVEDYQGGKGETHPGEGGGRREGGPTLLGPPRPETVRQMKHGKKVKRCVSQNSNI